TISPPRDAASVMTVLLRERGDPGSPWGTGGAGTSRTAGRAGSSAVVGASFDICPIRCHNENGYRNHNHGQKWGMAPDSGTGGGTAPWPGGRCQGRAAGRTATAGDLIGRVTRQAAW